MNLPSLTVTDNDVHDTPNILPSDFTQGRTNAELLEISRRAQKLLDNDPSLATSALAMRDSRRLFTMAATAMSRHLAEHNCKPDDGVEACLRQSMLQAAESVFTRTELAESLQKGMLPFMAQELAEEAEREQSARTEAEKQEAAVRTNIPVPVGYDFNGTAGLVRGEINVLTGNSLTVRSCLERALLAAGMRENPYIVRVCWQENVQNVQKLTADDEKKTLVTIGVNRWMHCAESVSVVGRFMAPWLRRCFKHRVDLLVIENLALAVRPLFEGSEPQRTAGRALKALRRWAAEVGCAVLAGLPIGVETEEQLRTETSLPGWDLLLKHSSCFRVWEQLDEQSEMAVFTGPIETDEAFRLFTV